MSKNRRGMTPSKKSPEVISNSLSIEIIEPEFDYLSNNILLCDCSINRKHSFEILISEYRSPELFNHDGNSTLTELKEANMYINRTFKDFKTAKFIKITPKKIIGKPIRIK